MVCTVCRIWVQFSLPSRHDTDLGNSRLCSCGSRFCAMPLTRNRNNRSKVQTIWWRNLQKIWPWQHHDDDDCLFLTNDDRIDWFWIPLSLSCCYQRSIHVAIVIVIDAVVVASVAVSFTIIVPVFVFVVVAVAVVVATAVLPATATATDLDPIVAKVVPTIAATSIIRIIIKPWSSTSTM